MDIFNELKKKNNFYKKCVIVLLIFIAIIIFFVIIPLSAVYNDTNIALNKCRTSLNTENFGDVLSMVRSMPKVGKVGTEYLARVKDLERGGISLKLPRDFTSTIKVIGTTDPPSGDPSADNDIYAFIMPAYVFKDMHRIDPNTPL